jgi:hypothetical protein
MKIFRYRWKNYRIILNTTTTTTINNNNNNSIFVLYQLAFYKQKIRNLCLPMWSYL